MKTAGERRTSPPNESWLEVHVLDGESTLAVLFSSVIDAASVSEKSAAITGCRVLIKLEDPDVGALISQGRGLRILVGNALVAEPVWLFRGTIDYVERRRESPDAPMYLEVHARAYGSRLLDEGFRGEIAGSLMAAINQLTKVEPVIHVSMPQEFGDVRAWVDAGSIFGAVQLLAVTVGAVITSEGRERFVLSTREAAFESSEAQPVAFIDASTARKIAVREGTPVRGLSDEDE
ncbi:hypothetical protein [Pendulispora albinea]|uniref:Uncharacterized protein n=1 Tax=Pendulispora albinea TaxID=2741071 RepID=A0ABZ2LSZ9_9BACT